MLILQVASRVGRALILALLILGLAPLIPASATTQLTLDGKFVANILRPEFSGSLCSSGTADYCGTMELAGLGIADFAYYFGPAFEPNGKCFDVDGTFTLTLQSDGSTITGPLTGQFCPTLSATAHEHGVGTVSWGNPYTEDDTVNFTAGSGQFEGLSGAATFHTQAAGARLVSTLSGTLNG